MTNATLPKHGKCCDAECFFPTQRSPRRISTTSKRSSATAKEMRKDVRGKRRPLPACSESSAGPVTNWLRPTAGCALLSDARAVRPDAAGPSMPSELTLREQSVTQLAIVGLSNREIGERLAISARTVECHMTSILHRLGLRSRHQLLESVRSQRY